MATSGSSVKVNGIAMAIAMTGPMPGIAPTICPMATPRTTKATFASVSASDRPARIVSSGGMGLQGSDRCRSGTTTSQIAAGAPTAAPSR